MNRMTGPDCAVMCNLINIHTYHDQTTSFTMIVTVLNPNIFRAMFKIIVGVSGNRVLKCILCVTAS